MRYLEWIHDPDPADGSYTVDFALLLRTGSEVRCQYDLHICGLFGHQGWLRLIGNAGFSPRAVSDTEPGRSVFLGIKRAA